MYTYNNSITAKPDLHQSTKASQFIMPTMAVKGASSAAYCMHNRMSFTPQAAAALPAVLLVLPASALASPMAV
jgi:hypothetical protein